MELFAEIGFLMWQSAVKQGYAEGLTIFSKKSWLIMRNLALEAETSCLEFYKL